MRGKSLLAELSTNFLSLILESRMSVYKAKVRGETKWVASSPHKSGDRRRWHRIYATKKQALSWWRRQEDEDAIPPDRRRLSELVHIYLQAQSANLKGSEDRARALALLTRELGDPIASDLRAIDFETWRQSMLLSGRSPKYMNNLLGYLKRVYSYLLTIEEIDYQNPLGKTMPVRVPPRELHFLTLEQLKAVLAECKQRSMGLYMVVRMCAETGARWGEANGFPLNQFNPKNNTVTFIFTKTNKARTVRVSDEYASLLASESADHLGVWNANDFATVLKACNIDRPTGQCTHLLRHTYASLYVMNGGRIYDLQAILGHSSFKMTQRYAHLSPNYLHDAAKFAPLVFEQMQ